MSDRWQDLEFLLTRPSEGNMTGPGFQPTPELLKYMQSDQCRLLVVGAGGLGCELLKDLALTGFAYVDVIDMDTIDVSNLNRQFLFRAEDVGKPKAEVAAARVNQRVSGAHVTPHYGRIEEKPLEWYKSFALIILGLDSLEARRYMNQLVCSMLEWDENGDVVPTSMKPMIDGGTEGLSGHARVIIPGLTPCFECTMWLFPPQVKFPLCTLAETPRCAAHCIEYVHLIQWGQDRPDEEFDGDIEEHLTWVFERAEARAKQFGIEGVTRSHTAGVVKNIIPAVATTNAIIAASCVLEALKTFTSCSPGMDNYMLYAGTAGIYTHTVKYEPDEHCLLCRSGVEHPTDLAQTLQQWLEALKGDDKLGGLLKTPSVYMGSAPLFAHGIYEADTRANLSRSLTQLGVSHGALLQVNDPGLKYTIRLRITAST